MTRMFLWIAVATVLSGCSLFSKSESEESLAAPLQTVQPESTEASVLLSAVANTQIPAGKCGMILWTLDAERPVPVFHYIAGDVGEITLGGAPQPLTLKEAAGAAGFGVYEAQSFESPGGVMVSVNVQFGQGFDGGAYLQKGLITVEQPDGWKSVTPAAGIAGCRSSS